MEKNIKVAKYRKLAPGIGLSANNVTNEPSGRQSILRYFYFDTLKGWYRYRAVPRYFDIDTILPSSNQHHDSRIRQEHSLSFACSAMPLWPVDWRTRRASAIEPMGRFVFHIDVDYMDCWHCSSRNILRHRVAPPSYVFTIVRARAHRFGPWYNQSFWYNTMVYVSYVVETEAVNAKKSICRKL